MPPVAVRQTMYRKATLILLAVLVLALPASAEEERAAASGVAVLLALDGPIGPASSDFVRRGIETAAERNAEVVIIRMDTPGGLDTAMRDIIKAILVSEVPVATWVGPGGSRAASAGTYILYASHVAAMAPATNLGAATPVPVGGSAPLPGGGEPTKAPAGDGGDDAAAGNDDDGKATTTEEEAPGTDAMSAKVVNDAVAYIRSLAEKRGRNAEWAEKAVREAASLSAEQALAKGVVDLIAEDVPGLLAAMDGKTVQLPDGPRSLATAGLTVERIEPDWRTELLATITNPTVAYLLLLIGIYGLLFEGYNPGAVLPGVAGAICLLLAAYAFQILPVNYAGLGLMALGLVLMISEIFVPSFGVLGIGGIIAFVAGSIILMDTDVPGYRIAVEVITAIGIVGSTIVMGIVWLAVRARARPVVSGMEEMIGATAEAAGDFADTGQVLVHGERWQAHSPRPVCRGERLRVTGVRGLTLNVEPIDTKED